MAYKINIKHLLNEILYGFIYAGIFYDMDFLNAVGKQKITSFEK